MHDQLLPLVLEFQTMMRRQIIAYVIIIIYIIDYIYCSITADKREGKLQIHKTLLICKNMILNNTFINKK